MNGEILMKAIGGISDRHITEFAEVKPTHKAYSSFLFKLIPAACLSAIVIASILLYQSHNSNIQLPISPNDDSTNNVLELPSNSSTNSSDPATSDPKSGITNEPSNPDSTTDAPPTTSDNTTTPEPPPSSQTTPGIENPSGVYQGQKVDYNTARNLFGHAIKECTAHNFIGYTVGAVSNTGNHDGSEKVVCIDINYNFTNGTITICDQDRMSGAYLYAESSEKIEYKGHIFMAEHDLVDKNHVRYGYYPTQQNGLAYIAVFDKGTDQQEIFDLILSLVV